MPGRIPVQHKSPFALDPRPLEETASSHAGLLATARAYRSLGVPDLVAANLTLKRRPSGFSESQFIETLLLLQTVGGGCPEDIQLLAGMPVWNGAWVLRRPRCRPGGPVWTAFTIRWWRRSDRRAPHSRVSSGPAARRCRACSRYWPGWSAA